MHLTGDGDWRWLMTCRAPGRGAHPPREGVYGGAWVGRGQARPLRASLEAQDTL